MRYAERQREMIDAAFREGRARRAVHLGVDDTPLDGREIVLGGRPVVNFASCSYLGLETDERLKHEAIAATERYGVQFSSSRAYLSAAPFAELEALLDRIFEGHTIVVPNTTLGHLAALPVLVEEGDAVILDQHVHQSVQLAAGPLRLAGAAVELVRHGRVDRLDERIRKLSAAHRRVFYLCDGVYSMYGDLAPTRALAWLLERHPSLHLYVDDAHGIGWSGRHGRGVAAEAFAGHERVVVAASLNKGFGAGGGALVFFDAEAHRRVRNCGVPLIFTGPLQPPMLGAAIASARIHLSPEIESLQAQVRERIELANRTARRLDLPLVSNAAVPIRFIGASFKEAAYEVFGHLREQGFYLNAAGFPAVGSRQNGLRFTLTRHQRPADIERMLEAVAERLPAALERAGGTRAELDRAFRLAPRLDRRPAPSGAIALRLEHATRIGAFDAEEWDRRLGPRGYDAATLDALEQVFGPEATPDSRWRFHYFRVCDAGGRPVLATFFTEALWKDDLLAAARVSRLVEQRRAADPSFLTSRVLAMGSLVSEGDHLWLDRRGPWQGALAELLGAVEQLGEACGSPALVLRDLPGDDDALAGVLEARGFVRLPLPDSLELAVDWSDREEFLAARTKRERRFHREQVEPFAPLWRLEVLDTAGRRPTDAEWAHWYGLYRNVQGRQLALNTFPLPEDLLPRLLDAPGWELLLLRESDAAADAPVRGLALCHAHGGTYAPLLVGMDYAFVESHGLYRQLLAHCVARARALGARRVGFGLGSELEKRRFGARPVQRAMYVQSHDRYHHDVLELLAADAHLGARR